MLKATDAKGNAITAEYDLLGRKLSLASVDGGRREYKYDAYRLLEETGPNLRAKGKWIGYEYDGLSRLVKVDYPETAATVYTYGDSGAADNAAGKVTQMTDASGTIKYRYGKLGEVTEETRTLSVKSGKQGETMTATTGYLSNYLGQMERISYPDGETVEYGYDAGGQVIRVSGRHYDRDFSYVSDIGYDEFGQRSYICYGNGVRTDYEYDPHRRWLSSIGTAKGRTPYQSISYSFDRVGNVLGYTNDCTAGGDYATSQSYAYDDLYQLVRAEGKTAYNPYKGTTMPVYESTYTQEFKFDILGNMTDKVSRETVRPVKVIGDELNYTKEFSYAEGFAHRIDHIAGTYYKYDLDGNVCALSKGGQGGGNSGPDGGSPAEGGGGDGWGLGDGWDDGDDGWGLGDDDWGATGDYEYNLGDGSGSSGGWGGDDGDGWGLGDDDWGGTGDYVYNLEEPEHDDGSMTLASYVWDERDRMIKSVNSTATAYYVYGEDGERTNKYTADSETLYFSRLWTWHGDKSIDDQVSKHIYLGEARIVSKLNSSGKNGSYGEERGKTYFYHPDHLGSAQLITDYKGDEYQRIEYTPYGEAWVDKIEDPLYVYMPYRFTGKELDAETGLYYYGARYLDPQTSVWLSTDPALGDYLPTAGADNSGLPGMGGLFNTTNSHLYHYAGNNPVVYTDPDGKVINFAIGATIGFVTAAASEVGGRMATGQSFSDAVKNTFTSKESWAVMGASAAIGCVTSGVSGIAVKAATATGKTVISVAAKEGLKEIAKVAIKTTAINTVSGAIDAGAKDVATKAIKGEKQNLEDTLGKMGGGAKSALLSSGLTEGIIAAGTATSGTITNVMTGTISDFVMYQPEWAGSVGVVGESIVPTAYDVKNALCGEN